MLCSEHPRLFLLFFYFPSGRICSRAVSVEAFSPLPFAEDGVAVEPRPVVAASTAAWSQPPPRRSLREEREARDLLALVKVTQEARRLAQRLRDARRAREARQLRQVVLLAAALRRAGFPR